MVTPVTQQECFVDSETQIAAPKTKVYGYRWVILGLFMMSGAMTLFQWIQYSIISNVVQKYYGVKSVYVDWLSVTFMLAYLPFNYPAMWLMDKKGLKVVTVLGSFCLCLGAWIKVVSVRPNLFYLAVIGQTVAGVGHVFVLNAPPRIAAVWFDQDQVSTACSIAVFGTQIGALLGVLLPPMAMKPEEDIDVIGSELSFMLFISAGICSIHLLLVILFFRAKPELPPSPGQASRVAKTPAFCGSLKRLSRNRGFVLLSIAYGLIMGASSALVTLFDQMFIKYFPSHGKDVGWIGLTVVIAGMFGAVVSGYILDKTRKFKESALGLYLLSAVGMLAFTFILPVNLGVVYGVVALLGFFMAAFLVVAYEFGVEISYPEPEGTTVGMMNLSANVFGILLTLGTSILLNTVGDLCSNAALTMTLFVGLLITALVKEDLRRQAAHSLGKARN